MKFDMLYVVATLLIIVIITTSVAAASFLSVRSEIARIQAEGIEQCYGLQCDHNYIGYVKCWTEPLPEPDMYEFGGVEFEPESNVKIQG